MTRFLIRSAALLIIPCLTVGPVEVSAFTTMPLHRAVVVSAARPLFEQEAVSAFLIGGWTKLWPRKRFKSAHRIRLAAAIVARSFSPTGSLRPDVSALKAGDDVRKAWSDLAEFLQWPAGPLYSHEWSLDHPAEGWVDKDVWVQRQLFRTIQDMVCLMNPTMSEIRRVAIPVALLNDMLVICDHLLKDPSLRRPVKKAVEAYGKWIPWYWLRHSWNRFPSHVGSVVVITVRKLARAA